MLTVATVYTCWQNDDWCDAYLFYPHAQVVFMRRVNNHHGITYWLWIQDDVGFYPFVLKPNDKLWIEEGINGVAA